jgi:hypothetical protein
MKVLKYNNTTKNNPNGSVTEETIVTILDERMNNGVGDLVDLIKNEPKIIPNTEYFEFQTLPPLPAKTWDVTKVEDSPLDVGVAKFTITALNRDDHTATVRKLIPPDQADPSWTNPIDEKLTVTPLGAATPSAASANK